MTRIFISYSRRDLDFVEQLAADLQAAGLDVWYDLYGLEGGQRWRIEIEKAIRESQYVIVVLSPDSVVSTWVEEEILYARNLKRKIVPLFYKPCDIPLGFQTLHFIDVQESKYFQNFKEILRALDIKHSDREIAEKVVHKKPEKLEEAPKPKKIRTNRKWYQQNTILLFIVTLGLILVAVFGLPALIGKLESPLVDTPHPTTTNTSIKSVATNSKTPKPNFTATTALTLTPSSLPTSECAHANLISETIPDNTIFKPNQTFFKTWEIKNTSTCTWDANYKVIFWGGNMLGGLETYNLSQNVPPGEVAQISIFLVSPAADGNYTSLWKLQTSDGVTFGIGDSSNPFFVEIVVSSK